MNRNILLRLSNRQMNELDFFVNMEKRTRTDVIRAAIDEYIHRNKDNEEEDIFGLWKRKDVNGIEYQERIRAEW